MRVREEYRYFFFITNDRATPADELVLEANGRCDQENLIAQLKGGVHALTTPVDDLVSNWAYMVMASLAWTLKAWAALLLPEEPRQAQEHRAEKQTLVADGVRDVPGGGDRVAVPDRTGWPAVDLPAAVVDPVARGLPAAGGAVARLLVVLRGGSPEVGVRMPRSVWAFERREGVGDDEGSSGRRAGGRDLREVEGTCLD